MAGFLDPEERVIDLVLTDTGKSLLLKGALRFSYWVPFDDEMNYQPSVTATDLEISQLTADELSALMTQRTRNMLEDPVIIEACFGYRGMNTRQEDTTNVHRPLFTAIPGAGHMTPLPTLVISETGSLDVQVKQTQMIKNMVRFDAAGNAVAKNQYSSGFQREAGTAAYLDVNYDKQTVPSDTDLEGFLITVYHNVSGTLQEVIHTRDSSGEVAYRNDLSVTLAG